jgi:hypothetical protein
MILFTVGLDGTQIKHWLKWKSNSFMSYQPDAPQLALNQVCAVKDADVDSFLHHLAALSALNIPKIHSQFFPFFSPDSSREHHYLRLLFFLFFTGGILFPTGVIFPWDWATMSSYSPHFLVSTGWQVVPALGGSPLY